MTIVSDNRNIFAVAVKPDGKQAIACLSDQSLKVWNLETLQEVFTIGGHTDWVSAVTVTPDGKQIISASDDNTLKVWNLETRQLIADFTGESSWECCAVAADGVQIIVGEASGRVHFLKLES